MPYLSDQFQKIIIAFVVGALIALAAYLYQQQLDSFSQQPLTSDINQQERVYPNAYVKNAYIQRYNKNGEIELKITTPNLEQYSEKKIMTLDTPQIDYNANYNYRVTSDIGTLINKQNLLLEKNAKIRKTNSKQSMEGEIFNIDLVDKTITSDQKVILKSAEGITIANGLHADINKQVIKLTNKVKGVYVP